MGGVGDAGIMLGGEQNETKVSVCIPAFCAADYLAATMESVLAQTHSNWELIVLDNNSSDRTGQIARSYKDSRITVERNSTTLEMADNWNAVAKLASAPYLKLLCADDLIHPECLAEQVAVLEDNDDISIVGARRHFIDDDGQVVLRDRGLDGLLGTCSPQKVIDQVVGSGINPIGWPAALLFRRDVFVDVGMFDTRWSYPIDLDLSLRMLRGGSFHGLEASLASFRISPNSASSVMPNLGTEHRRLLRTIAADPMWNVDRRTLWRGLAMSHVEVVKKQLLFGAVNSRWAPLRRLPAAVLQPRHRRKKVGAWQAAEVQGVRSGREQPPYEPTQQ